MLMKTVKGDKGVEQSFQQLYVSVTVNVRYNNGKAPNTYP